MHVQFFYVACWVKESVWVECIHVFISTSFLPSNPVLGSVVSSPPCKIRMEVSTETWLVDCEATCSPGSLECGYQNVTWKPGHADGCE